MSDAAIVSLYRYPVKGLSAEALNAVELRPGAAIEFDRAYAIENGGGRFDPGNPKPLPKTNFLMLMRNERLATVTARFDAQTHTLTLLRDGRQVAKGVLTSKLGRQMIEQFLAAYLKAELRGAPRIVHAPGHHFADHPEPCLHIVNLGSVRELERIVGRRVDPLRFRPNLVIEGLPAFEEVRWIGQQVNIGDAARLEVFERTERCEATNVDPVTGARDMGLPRQLLGAFGRADFGVYARVVAGGMVRIGDQVALTAS